MPSLPPNTPHHKHEQLAALMKMCGETPLPKARRLPVRIPDEDPKSAASRVAAEFNRIFQKIEDAARDFDAPLDGTSVISKMFFAGHRMAGHWKTRTRFLERTLRSVLASDLVADAQRSELLAVLYGKAGVGRDPKLLNEHETELIRLYRAGTAPDKAMVRNLFARLWGGAK